MRMRSRKMLIWGNWRMHSTIKERKKSMRNWKMISLLKWFKEKWKKTSLNLKSKNQSKKFSLRLTNRKRKKRRARLQSNSLINKCRRNWTRRCSTSSTTSNKINNQTIWNSHHNKMKKIKVNIMLVSITTKFREKKTILVVMANWIGDSSLAKKKKIIWKPKLSERPMTNFDKDRYNKSWRAFPTSNLKNFISSKWSNIFPMPRITWCRKHLSNNKNIILTKILSHNLSVRNRTTLFLSTKKLQS